MLSKPDFTKNAQLKIDDDTAEDITDQVTTTYTAKNAITEIMADISENTDNARINTLHMVAT